MEARRPRAVALALPRGPGGGTSAGIPAPPRRGPPQDSPGCRSIDDQGAIEDAFQIALDRWIHSAQGIYGRKYALVAFAHDLHVDIDGRGAVGEVEWNGTVYNKQLHRNESATGVIDMRFEQFGCT